ncbi:MAG TPA: hypothetical protein PLD84_07865, partial [Chitinophagales bacterium]|nr:hypothetical protein [Chitinophagales bacterium]
MNDYTLNIFRLSHSPALLKYLSLVLLVIMISSCRQKRYLLETRFSGSAVPPPPDYSKEDAWAALPSKKDAADSLPGKNLSNGEESAIADVF